MINDFISNDVTLNVLEVHLSNTDDHLNGSFTTIMYITCVQLVVLILRLITDSNSNVLT